MMKRYIYILLFFSGMFLAGGCEKSEIAPYDLKEGINFMQPSNSYNEDDAENFYKEFNFGVNPKGENLRKDTLWIHVKTQGVTPDYSRRVAFKLDSILRGEPLLVTFLGEYSLEGGEYKASFPVLVSRPSRDSVSSVTLTFDYENSDFTRGSVERQTFRLDYQDVVTMESVGMSDWYWNMMFSEFGKWSNTKARFIITTMGVIDFTYLNPWGGDLQTLKTALAEYKAKSLEDPNAYPPYYDETLYPEKVWITF